MFHINVCSLGKNFDDLEYLLKTTNMNFDIIAISETITKNANKISNINLNNYAFEFTPTKYPQQEKYQSTLQIIISQELTFKFTKKWHLESTFIEIINPKKSNIIIRCICRHPNMDLNDFNNFKLFKSFIGQII